MLLSYSTESSEGCLPKLNQAKEQSYKISLKSVRYIAINRGGHRHKVSAETKQCNLTFIPESTSRSLPGSFGWPNSICYAFPVIFSPFLPKQMTSHQLHSFNISSCQLLGWIRCSFLYTKFVYLIYKKKKNVWFKTCCECYSEIVIWTYSPRHSLTAWLVQIKH